MPLSRPLLAYESKSLVRKQIIHESKNQCPTGAAHFRGMGAGTVGVLVKLCPSWFPKDQYVLACRLSGATAPPLRVQNRQNACGRLKCRLASADAWTMTELPSCAPRMESLSRFACDNWRN